jgi:hypothetical protein
VSIPFPLRFFCAPAHSFYPYLTGPLLTITLALEGLVEHLFRRSYGRYRNYTLLCTLGGFMVRADDDMRLYTLMECSPESRSPDDVCRD